MDNSYSGDISLVKCIEIDMIWVLSMPLFHKFVAQMDPTCHFGFGVLAVGTKLVNIDTAF